MAASPISAQQESFMNPNNNSSYDFPASFSPKELYNDLLLNGSIPQTQAFIRDPPILHSNPVSNLLSSSIPTIDMRRLQEDDHALLKLHSACKNWGLFLLTNHGVDPCITKKLKVEIEEFFKLPLEEKMRFKVKPGESQGYGQSRSFGFKHGQKLDWSDRFYMFVNPVELRNPNLFPMLPESLKEALEAYIEEVQKVAMKIMGWMAKALKIEEGEVLELFENGMQSMRMTYYPPHPEPERVVGITPHSDATGITILYQLNDVGGLEINKDGVWIPVHVPPGALVVNVGDVMEMVSNGIYKSVEHRVSVNSKKERMSIAMFFNPKMSGSVGPSRSLIADHLPPRFKTVKMQRYVEEYFTTTLDGKSYLDKMRLLPS